MSPTRLVSIALGVLALAIPVVGDDSPCVSGLRPGQRPGPYSAVVAVGEKRGISHCFVCETADRPAVIVFARTTSEPLAKLVAGLDRALLDHKKADLRAWVTLLAKEEATAGPAVAEWARKNAVRSVPLAVFEDPDGPPSYRISRDAEFTVLLSVKQKVVRNFAFRSGELTEARVADVLNALPDLLSAK